ncbi:hypothetical protein D3C86_2235150 [compost metagenome]
MWATVSITFLSVDFVGSITEEAIAGSDPVNAAPADKPIAFNKDLLFISFIFTSRKFVLGSGLVLHVVEG